MPINGSGTKNCIVPEPLLNMLDPLNFPGTLLISIPIDSNRYQLISWDSRIMLIFVHSVHSLNQQLHSQDFYSKGQNISQRGHAFSLLTRQPALRADHLDRITP